ncbi:MAG: ribose-phosphate pyrophosphokinase [Nevskia sp.]|nr:ribose-phosphate pyrophosphokinase [Nevskia sp.]
MNWDTPPLLFALGATRALGERVAARAGLPLAALEEREFEDGEHKTRPLESVRGRDVYVVQSLYGEPSASVNDKLCRLLFFVGALKDAGAARVTVLAPYLCYARKDRKTKPRDPVTTRYLAELFEAVGSDCVVTVDVHNLAAYQNSFRCRTEHLEARPLFVDHFAALAAQGDWVVVSPDAGGVKRAAAFRRALAQRLGRALDSGLMEKRRSGGVLSGARCYGEVRGRGVIVIDDLVSSGATLVRTARACRAQGARAVYAAATHGLFAANAAETLCDPALDRLVVCNTVPPLRLAGSPAAAKLTVLDLAPLLGECVRRLHEGGSIVELTELPE